MFRMYKRKLHLDVLLFGQLTLQQVGNTQKLRIFKVSWPDGTLTFGSVLWPKRAWGKEYVSPSTGKLILCSCRQKCFKCFAETER